MPAQLNFGGTDVMVLGRGQDHEGDVPPGGDQHSHNRSSGPPLLASQLLLSWTLAETRTPRPFPFPSHSSWGFPRPTCFEGDDMIKPYG